MAALTACGRIDFDPAVAVPTVRYDHVFPVYITGYTIPTLVPVVTGIPDHFEIAPALPPGLAIDPMVGTIDGTPAAVVAPAFYTVTASNARGAASTTIRLRTADGYVVNDSGDADDATPGDMLCETATGNGLCTLRAAETEVNADGGSKGVVLILAQTIALGRSLSDLVQSLELVGVDTTSVIIDGNGASIVSFGGAVSLTFSYLTAQSSGPINHNYIPGITLVVDHALVRNNAGFAALGAGGNIVLADSTFDSNTVEVVNAAGTVTIDRCTFVNNTTAPDGVVFMGYGQATITNSTFVNNTGYAGAVELDNATGTFVHDTFVGNHATGAYVGGAVTEYSGGGSTWTNTLVVNNVADYGNCKINGAFTSNGGNLVFPADGGCLFGATDAASADPLLAPLADNGGVTMTMALGGASPAIDAASTPGCVPIDQRGGPRPLGAACDIGAVEQR
jgi:hypothetical protein